MVMSTFVNRQVYLQKLINRRDDIATYTDDNGYIFMGLFQFLRNDRVLE